MLSPNGGNARLAPLAFHFRDRVPLKGESPVKTSDHRLVRLHVILKGVPVNGVDHRAHDGTGIFTNPEHKAWPIQNKERERKKYMLLSILVYRVHINAKKKLLLI